MNRNEKLIMFRKPMSNVALRRFATVVTTLALSVSGLVFSPAHANVPVNGSYSCATGVKDDAGNKYTITSGVVSAGTACTGAVVIPSGVTSIGLNAFQNSLLTSITIPASVTSLGNNSLRSSNSLSVVRFLGTTAPTVGSAVFTFSSYPVLLIEPGVTAFGALNSVWNGLTVLDYAAFQSVVPNGSYSCANGVKDEAGTKYQITNGVVFGGGSCTGAVRIPESVRSIANDAFGAAQTMTSVDLPSTVISIGEYAFRYTRALGSITIPASVQTIGTYAFGDTNKLASVTFQPGSQLKSIGESAFREAGLLTSFEVPSGVTSIGAYAFRDSTKLATITIPASVTSIGNDALSNTRALKSIVVDSNNPNYKVESDVLFNKAGTTLIKYPAQKVGTEYIIPESVTNIDGAFSGASNLVSVTIPAGVTSIGNYTFLAASKLESINIPVGVTTIGEQAFAQTRLTSIVIPASVTSIGREAFAFARQLTSIEIPEGVTSIKAFTFYQNINLASITLPASLISIEEEVFFSAGLTSVTIPANVTSIGNRAFEDTRLTSITFQTGSKLETIGSRAFLDAKQLTQIEIPASVKSIGEDAFRQAYALASVKFQTGSTLETIGSRAFLDTKKLSAVIIPASVISIGDEAFRRSLELDSVRFLGNVAPTVGTDAFTGVASSAKAIIESGATLAFPATGNPARWNGLDVLVPTKFYEDTSFNSKGGSTVATRWFADEITAPTAPTRTGYTFAGWTATDGDATTVTFPYAPSETSNITLYAKWTATPYSVTYDAKGGTAVSNGSFTVLNDVAEPTEPTRAGYAFVGWTATDGANTTVTFPYAPGVTAGITLYAKWNQEFVVTYDSKGGTAVTSGSFANGGSIDSAPTAPTWDNYAFLGWSATDGGTVLTYPYSPGLMEDITLYAKWRKMSPEITAGATPNSQVATFPVGLTDAAIPATASLPRIRFVLPVMAGDVVATIAPTANPATPTKTPFIVSGSTKVVDINVTGVTGNVTVCLDGGPTDELYHYTGGAWVKLPERSYVNGQVCGVTSSFSPFTAATPAPFKPRLGGSPAISGNARQNTLLASTSGTWSALPAATTSVQWYRCDKSVSARKATITAAMKCLKITGATKSKYKVVLADQGKHLTVLSQAKNKMGSTFSTAKSVLVPKATIPVMKSTPKISGSAVKGSVLTLGAGTWTANPTPATTQQWYRCDKPVSVGLSEFKKSMDCVKITGATKAQYKITVADQAKYLTALVTGKNSQGILAKSAKSVKIPGTKPARKTSPKISGSANAGGTLRATDGTWSGIPEADTSVQWYRCSNAVSAGGDSLKKSSNCVKISGATSSRYTVKLTDQGKYLTVLVKAKNEAGSASATAKSIYVKVPVVKP